jgi:hypothetical protein
MMDKTQHWMRRIYQLFINTRPEYKYSQVINYPGLFRAQVGITHTSLQFQSVRHAIYGFAVTAIIALLLIAAGCNQSGPAMLGEQVNPDLYIQPVSGKTRFGANWKDIVPPSPLQVVENEQSIRLKLVGINDMTHSDSLILSDGRMVTISAIAVTDSLLFGHKVSQS